MNTNRFLINVCAMGMLGYWTSCDSQPKPPTPEPEEVVKPLEMGYWRCFLYPDSLQTDNYLPFELSIADSTWNFDYVAEYATQSLQLTKDSVLLRLTDSTSVALRRYSSEMRGVWRFDNGKKEMAMVVLPSDGQRFQMPVNRGNLADISGTWEWSGGLDSLQLLDRDVYFNHDPRSNRVDADCYNRQNERMPFRGDFDGAQLRLSYFDGKRPFLLKGVWRTKGILEGKCWIGTNTPISWQLLQIDDKKRPAEETPITFER